MNQNRITKILPVLAALLGAVTMVLRCGLYLTGLDEKNLLMDGHLLSTLVWASVIAAVLILGLPMIRLMRGAWEDDSTQPDIVGAIGALVLSLAIGGCVYTEGLPFTLVEKLSTVVGLLCVPCLMVAAVYRVKGQRPFFLCHGVVCVWFCLHLVMRYSVWSANPQLQDYVFAMLACVCLGLFAYQQTALDVQMGSGKLQYVFGLLAGFLGIAALYGAEPFWLYPAGALWALTNLSRPAVATWYHRAKEER
jgi:hypothetical protein